jgi:hypothetical protein
MKSKYNLILCELYNLAIHGLVDETNDLNIQTHYILFNKYEPFSEEYVGEIDDPYDGFTDMQRDIRHLKRLYSLPIRDNITSSPIRNYRNIVSRPNYIQREIGEVIMLPTFEEIVILKTFWIRIFQKKWKKVFQERKRILKQRCHPSSIYYWQIHGIWPLNCK